MSKSFDSLLEVNLDPFEPGLKEAIESVFKGKTAQNIQGWMLEEAELLGELIKEGNLQQSRIKQVNPQQIAFDNGYIIKREINSDVHGMVYLLVLMDDKGKTLNQEVYRHVRICT